MWYVVFPKRRPSAGAAAPRRRSETGAARARAAAAGSAAGAALLAALAAQPAAAATFEYTFTVTFEAERVYTNHLSPIEYHVTDHPDVPEKIEPGWVDPAWLGVDFDRSQFGLDVGESARGSFRYHEADGTHALTVGGRSYGFAELWLMSTDPDSGDAAFKASSWWDNTVLNFITDDGYHMDDSAGDVGSHTEILYHPRYEMHYEEYTPYHYHGYTSYFTFSDVERLSPSPREGGPAPRSMFAATTPPVPYGDASLAEPTAMPLPAAPLLVLTGLGALALLRRRA